LSKRRYSGAETATVRRVVASAIQRARRSPNRRMTAACQGRNVVSVRRDWSRRYYQ
jgi:hypothetical protein